MEPLHGLSLGCSGDTGWGPCRRRAGWVCTICGGMVCDYHPCRYYLDHKWESISYERLNEEPTP
jgi:hypothetical protein